MTTRNQPKWRNAALTMAGYFMLLTYVMAAQTSFAESPTTQPIDPAVENTDSLPASSPEPLQTSLDSIAQKLTTVKLKQVPDVVDELVHHIDAQKREPFVLSLLNSMLNGELYYQKSDSTLVIAKVNQDKQFDLFSLESGELIKSSVVKKTIKKVRTSNKVRKSLRASIAKLQLSSKNIDKRIASINDLMSNTDESTLALLKAARLNESNTNVLSALDTAIAIGDLDSSDETTVLNALKHLQGSLEPQARNAITKLAEKPATEKIGVLAQQSLKEIESSVAFYGYVERIFFGLSLGSILLLVAAGLAITFGVMGVINMAHGELIMIGAYTTYVVQLLMPNHIAYSLLVAIPAAFIVSGLFGIAIERGVIQFLKGRPLETLLATFGISLILQQLVRTVFSPLNRQVVAPEFMSGAWQINPVLSLTYNRIYILIFALVVFFLLQLLMRKTNLGLNVRAVSQNRNMARAMGIKSKWVDAMTFGLGSGIAGLAGVALTQITNVGPNLGQSYIIDSFMVVVFGGVGNLWGTFVGAFAVGGLNKFLEPAMGTVLSTIVVLVLIILFIQRRPRGLFPQKGRAAES